MCIWSSPGCSVIDDNMYLGWPVMKYCIIDDFESFCWRSCLSASLLCFSHNSCMWATFLCCTYMHHVCAAKCGVRQWCCASVLKLDSKGLFNPEQAALCKVTKVYTATLNTLSTMRWQALDYQRAYPSGDSRCLCTLALYYPHGSHSELVLLLVPTFSSWAWHSRESRSMI